MKEKTAKIISWVIVIVYFISPVDLFPDFLIPIFAYIDDIAVFILRGKIQKFIEKI